MSAQRGFFSFRLSWMTLLIALSGGAAWSQGVLINEWSQGNGGAREWVEILVVQDGLNLRDYKLTDGTHGPADVLALNPSSSLGLQFNPSSAMWASVPAGTLIVIYNGNSRDTVLPPDDLSLSDGNHVIIAPHTNTTLFSSALWNGMTDSDNTESPRLWDSSDALVHDWDQSDDAGFLALHPGSGQAVAYLGGTEADVGLPAEWTRILASQGNPSPGKSNGGANTSWILTLQGGGAQIETSVYFLEFGALVVSGSRQLSYQVTGYNLTTSITVTVPSGSGFEVSTIGGVGWTDSLLLNKVGGKVYVRFSPTGSRSFSAVVTHVSGSAGPEIVTCSGQGYFTMPGLSPNDVIFNEYMVDDSGGTVYPSLGYAITGDWAELLVVNGPLDLRGWIATDENTPGTSAEGEAVIPSNPALSDVPRGTVALLIFGTSAVPEDLDYSDGRIILKASAGGTLSVVGNLDVDALNDNLVLISKSGIQYFPLDFISELEVNASAASWLLEFDPQFTGITADSGAWFSTDASGQFNNDDGTDSYDLLGYGWSVTPAKSTFTPGALNPPQALAILQVTPAQLDFGTISPTATRTRPVLITNTGIIPLYVYDTSDVGGPDAAYFLIDNGQLPMTIAPNATQPLEIRFVPNGTVGLLDNAVLNLRSNDDKHNNLTTVTLVGLSLVGASEQFFYEPFDYEAGSLVSASSSLWQHTAGGTNYMLTDQSSLTYPGLPPSVGRLAWQGNRQDLLDPRDEDVLREFELLTPPVAGSKAIYVSLLVNASSVVSASIRPEGDYFCHFYDGSSGFLFRGRLYARQATGGDGSKVQFGVKFSNWGDPVFANAQIDIGATVFLVMKLTMNRDSADSVSLYINPVADEVEPAGADATQFSTGGTGAHDIETGVGAFGLRQGEYTLNGLVDEIRVGWRWESVTNASSPPYIVLREPLWIMRGETGTITRDHLRADDLETPDPSDLLFTVTDLPDHGALFRNGLQMNLSSNSTFTQADINAGRITYTQDGSAVQTDEFLFRLSDPQNQYLDSYFPIEVLDVARAEHWHLFR